MRARRAALLCASRAGPAGQPPVGDPGTVAKQRFLESRRRWAFAAACALGAPRLSAETPAPAPLLASVGRPAPAFSLRDTTGAVHESAALVRSHRVTVLNFWATWCAPCVRELPEFDAVWRDLRGQGVAMLAINAMESAEKVRAFAQRVPLGMPLLLDPEGEVVGAYVGFSAGLPMTFLIDERGIVRHRVAGPMEGEALKSRLLAMLQARAAPRGAEHPPKGAPRVPTGG